VATTRRVNREKGEEMRMGKEGKVLEPVLVTAF
jgi:hypothetical protein